MRATNIEIKKGPPIRYGDLIAQAVEFAVADIDRWFQRFADARRNGWKDRSKARLILREIRHNARLADGWLSGEWKSTLSFRECCELLGQDHATCLAGVYQRWSVAGIMELRTARPRNDYSDLDVIFPGDAAGTLLRAEDLDEIDVEDADDDDGEEEGDGDAFQLAKEGANHARVDSKGSAATKVRRSRTRAAASSGQGLFDWGSDAGNSTDHADSRADRPELCAAGG